MLEAKSIGTCTGEPTAHARARYRCFLPDLAGLAGLRRVGPGTLQGYHRRRSYHVVPLPPSPMLGAALALSFLLLNA